VEPTVDARRLRLGIFLVNDQIDAQLFYMYLFQFPAFFEQPRAHYQDLHKKRSPTQSDIYQMLY